MQVTFLAHSGFLVELPSVTLLFDWWKGELPTLPEKPLLVFASHEHNDHFNPHIFSLDDGRDVRFLLGSDIRLTAKNKELWGINDETASKSTRMAPGETLEVLPGVTVETLQSTDEGVAFLVCADGETIFHAGDLNWWHWEGEPDPWNPDMARNFKAYAEPLRNRRVDLAMLPLDPRLGEAGFWGPKYFLELADICRFLPMHQWKSFDLTETFLQTYPQFRDRTVSIAERGQTFSFDA
jgi:L-ascorbate metabolism protein UlaG (beta-lactamase superfamily)